MKIFAIAFPFLWVLVALQSRGDGPATGHELIHSKPAATRPSASDHQLKYKLEEGSENWDPQIKQQIVKAMDQAVAIYNANGKFDRTVGVVYSAGTPTADANYNGHIRFGGQIGTRTALHELGHIMGVGTHPNWEKFAKDGKWTGEYALRVLHELDGPDAVLHCDHQHFWPYGLNYENEGGPENFVKHVKIVQAFRVDLGIDPLPPVTVKPTTRQSAASAAAEAQVGLESAQNRLDVLTRGLQSTIESKPEVSAAAKAATQAKLTYDQATARTLKSLVQQPDYVKLKAIADAAQRRLDDLRSDNASSYNDRSTASQSAMAAKADLNAFESRALAANSEVASAKAASSKATDALASVREIALKSDPQWLAAKKAVESARATLDVANRALADASRSGAAK